MGIVSKIFGTHNDREIKRINKTADLVEALAEKYKSKTDDELRATTDELKERLKNGETLDDILPDAFAVVREASERVLKMRHFYVQLVGGIVLHQGRIAEMKTGEGKTLVATLPAYLNALSGNGVHIVTVNEYLARRDSEWMGKIFRFLGLTVGVVVPQMEPPEKQAAYACDIIYATNNELGFDYLRDNMAVDKKDRLQKKLTFAIIDEVDSILIDEARTPLIISGAANKSSELYLKANTFVKKLETAIDFEFDEKDKTIRLIDDGVAKAEKYFNIENLGDIENLDITHHINIALKANFVMKSDSDYIVTEDRQIMIIDEFTGRQMIGRRYSDGLHQAIEAKENVKIQNESKTYATITFQNYFRQYKKLSGMTGTAKTEEIEFQRIYALDVVEVPTNKPMLRKDFVDQLYKTKKGKLNAILEDIKACYEKGQPVLVGTITVEKSEEISNLLRRNRIFHNVLNAKFHDKEAEIIAQAGKMNGVTIATNMAGRGTDIMLGGNPEYLAKQKMTNLGYSHELISAATSFAYTTDEQVAKAKSDYNHYFELFKKDIDAEKEKVIAAGGLRIIGTERHDSRRIDNQLRGRSGRQGDIGSTVFYISMEDDIARLFGGETLYRIADRFNLDEDMPIANKIITRQIEKAQLIVESRNFSARKNVLNYDDIMNQQREVIYKQRNKVLDEGDIHEDILQMIKILSKDIVKYYCGPTVAKENWDIAAMNNAINDRLLPNFEDEETGEKVNDDVIDDALAQSGDVQKMLDAIYTRSVSEFDSKKQYINELELDFAELERVVLLRAVDRHWINHIDDMEELKRGVGLRAYAQKDPVVIFRQEGYEMFDDMIFHIQRDTVQQMFKLTVKKKEEEVPKYFNRQMLRQQGKTRMATSGENEHKVVAVKRSTPRNALCPCGSGKKYKTCCGKDDIVNR